MTPPATAPLNPATAARPTVSAPWGRGDWVALADRMLRAARSYASPDHALITLPGPEGGYGRAVDGLEGFARTLVLAGFRIAGERGSGLDDLTDWYAAGIAAGTDPTSAHRWPRLDEHPQAKVEAASLALALDMTRPWLWDRLSERAREQVVDYLAPAVGDDTYPRINWVWFRLVVQTFLRSVGGPFSIGEMAEDLATHDSFVRPDGWLSDGPERSYDHYVGWALHLYPTLWSRMSGAADLAADRRERDRAGLDRFLEDAITLIGADGSPLIQGRSLIYRFAAAAPFWVGVMAEVPSLSVGQLRRAATSVVGHFVAHGSPDADDLLTLGWHRPWPRLAQHYSGPGSPYWASKGLLGIALPADHPVWTAPEEPLPIENRDTVRAVRAPGWVISATRADGIVRVTNHGTDHAVEGDSDGDSPLYARLGYCTVTSPVLAEAGWLTPLDQSVTLVDQAGRATHRAGFRSLGARVDSTGVGVAGSRALAHWLEPSAGQRDHGSGRTGRSWPAGHLTVWSLVRGPWELRLTRIDDIVDGVDATALRLVVGGWAIPGEATVSAPGMVTVTGRGLTSRVVSIHGAGSAAVTEVADGGPLGGPLTVPWVEHPARVGAWTATLIELSATGVTVAHRRPCRAVVDDGAGNLRALVDWPDGVTTDSDLGNDLPSPSAWQQQGPSGP
ncbi:DUF2264 domain-containing protein [Micromonospora sp. NPDC003944]